MADVLPDLCAQICQLLREESEHEVAAVFPHLPFLGWCECGDDFCQGFHTAPKPEGAYGQGHRMLALWGPGHINLDLVHDTVMYVEVLNRPDIKDAFQAT
ncbi:hypothetical protein [Yinghuangia sp. YIM S09857]|uniref:hypothetical protein n=1 Tax=Yinghuangia sp. YIM S09857 TaxID=3436929 RepID=UPI003F52EF9B